MDSRNSSHRRSSSRAGRAGRGGMSVPRGSSRPGGQSPRAGSPYQVRGSGGSQPRVSTVKVGSFAPGRSSRFERINQAYRAHVRKVLMVLVAAAILAVISIAVYFSPLFGIKQVTVSGVEHLTGEEMTQLAGVPGDTTLLRVDTGAIADNIMRDAWVASVDVQKVFPDTINLAVKERPVGAVVEVGTQDGESTEFWALSSDGIWLCPIPEEGSEASKAISPKIYEDKANALAIKDVAYSVRPEIGAYCTDESITNALDVVTGLTTELKDQVKAVSATSAENTTITLDSNVEIAFGLAEDIRDKERVCLQIMSDNPGAVSYINVRVAAHPTWRAF